MSKAETLTADFRAQNLRWHGRQARAVHDRDSLEYRGTSEPPDHSASGGAVAESLSCRGCTCYASLAIPARGRSS
jgi:hypothetical protein